MKRGPYKSKPPASTPQAYRGRVIVPLSELEGFRAGSNPEPAPEPNFVTALVEAFVKEKLKRRRKA